RRAAPAVLPRRAAPAGQRGAGRDVPRGPPAAAAAGLRPPRGVAQEALPRAARHHGALAGLRTGRARLRRPRPAGLPLPRAVVDPARHDDPAADDPGRAPAPGRVLSLRSGTLPRAPR